MEDEKVLQEQSGHFSVTGLCPKCGNNIAVHIHVDNLKRGRKNGRWMKRYPEIDPLLPNFKDKDIAKQLDIPIHVINNRRHILKIKTPDISVASEKREKVKKLRGAGFTTPEIGRALRLSRQRVEQILKDL
jgi:hypothetical protein